MVYRLKNFRELINDDMVGNIGEYYHLHPNCLKKGRLVQYNIIPDVGIRNNSSVRQGCGEKKKIGGVQEKFFQNFRVY
jgi:hypothetical protein